MLLADLLVFLTNKCNILYDNAIVLTFADVITSRYNKRDSDSFDSFDSDEEGHLCNTAIIYGQCGSGKTSLVIFKKLFERR